MTRNKHLALFEEGYYATLWLVYNGGVVTALQRNNQRESQVPASAVIPALRVNDNVAAVKTFVAHIGTGRLTSVRDRAV